MPDTADHPTQPQQAFEELARITLADHSLDTVMDKIAALTKSTVPGASEVSVTFIERGRPTTVAFTGGLALRLDESQYERGYGPCLDSIAGGQPLHVDSMACEDRWPQWAANAREQGAGSSLSVPVPLQREVAAALNIYSTDEHAFDEHSLELASTFAAYAGVALANMHLYEAQGRVAEQLQAAMQSRAVIEQAKGILMGARRISAVDAFNLLIRLSQDTNRKLRDVAQHIVDEATSTAEDRNNARGSSPQR
jgi:GAF domain-containing protein